MFLRPIYVSGAYDHASKSGARMRSSRTSTGSCLTSSRMRTSPEILGAQTIVNSESHLLAIPSTHTSRPGGVVELHTVVNDARRQEQMAYAGIARYRSLVAVARGFCVKPEIFVPPSLSSSLPCYTSKGDP